MRALAELFEWLASLWFWRLWITTVTAHCALCALPLKILAISLQVAAGLFEWLTPWWMASLGLWAGALGMFHAVRAGRLELPWLRMVPAHGAGDIETGVPLVRIVDGVLDRR